MTISIKDIPLQQWLFRIKSGAYSDGAPENYDRFQKLANSISSLETAPSRHRKEVEAVMVTVQTMTARENYFYPELLKLTENALSSLTRPRSS